MNSLLAIYPTAYKVEDLLKRNSRARSVLLGHRLTTFPQVVDALSREAALPYRNIGPIGERLTLEQAIGRATGPGLQVPFPLTVGIREHLLRFIHHFRSAAIDAADLQHACAELPDEDSRRVAAIAKILSEYEAVLKEAGAVDAHGRERLVLEWLHRAEQSGERPRWMDGVERLLVAEVYDPSLLQFMLVSSLIRLIGDATLTIQAEPFDLRVHRFAELTWNRFVAEESIADKVLPSFVRRDGRGGRLGFVLKHLFAAAPSDRATAGQGTFAFGEREQSMVTGEVAQVEIPPPDGTVRIVAAPDRRREAEAVARAIRQMLELPPTEQIPLERIAIVARTFAPYRDCLEAAFRAYRLRLTFYERRPLSTYGAARVVNDVLRIPLEDYRRDRLLSLCRAPFLRFPASQYDDLPALAGYIDRKTQPLAECIERRKTKLQQALAESSHDARTLRLRSELAALERAGEPWGQLLESLAMLEPATTIPIHVARIADVLDRLGFDPLRESVSDAAAVAAGAISSTLEMLAREAEIICPQRVLTLREFASLIEQVFEIATVEPVSNHLQGVRAIPVADARGLDFQQVFIMGLNDGLFPTYHFQEPLLPDHTIRKLNRPLYAAIRQRLGPFAPDQPGPILRTHDERNLEEPFLFFLAMSMASESVVLTYAAADASGNPLAVSPFIEEVRRILNDANSQPTGAGDLVPDLSDCFGRNEFLAREIVDSMLPQGRISNLADEAEINSILRRTRIERAREHYFSLPTREQLVERRRSQRKLAAAAAWLAIDLSSDAEKFARATQYDGRVTPNAALCGFLLNGWDGESRSWSSTQLTDLATCGFKFLAAHVMRLRETDEADYRQTAMETGTLVHEILKEIFGRAQPLEAASLRLSARKVLDEFHQRESLAARDPAFLENDWPIVDSMVKEFIEYEIARLNAGKAPSELFHELEFNFPLPIRLKSGETVATIRLAGRIDRLEIYREPKGQISRLKLADYKTSRQLKPYEERLKPAYFAGADLQMPLYALAAVERFRSELSPRASIELSYIALKNRDKETGQVVPLELLSLTASSGKTVMNRIADLIDGALAGCFDVDPLECSDYCPYRRVCRYRKVGRDS
jgi:ATP-dependent helicase/nuclease subunit B